MREFVVRRQRAHRYGAPSPPTLHSTPQHPRDLKNLPSSLPPLHPRHFLFFFLTLPPPRRFSPPPPPPPPGRRPDRRPEIKKKRKISRGRGWRGSSSFLLQLRILFFFFFFSLAHGPWARFLAPVFAPPPPRALGGHFILFPSHGRAPPLRSLPLDPRRKLALSRLLRVAFALTVPAVLATCACGSGESSSGRRRSGGALFSYFFQVGFLLDSCAPSIGIAGQVFRRTGGGRRAGGGFALFPACFLFDRGWFVILEAEGLILAYSGVTCSICHFFKWVASM